MKYPNIFTLKSLAKTCNEVSVEIGGRYMPSRPLGYPSFRHRLAAAWLVFTGRADAVTWPGGQ